MNRRLFLIIIPFMIFSSAIGGAEYDLQSILKLAESRNKEIKLAAADLKLASARKMEAWSQALPKVNLDLNYNRNFLQNVFFFTITDSTGRRRTTRFQSTFNNELQVNAVLSQTIFAFGKVGKAISAAGDFDHFTELQYSAQWQDVITRVKKAFYQTLLLQKVWQVAKASEESARDNYQNTKTKYESGVVSEFDLLQAEVRWQNAIPETMKARKNYQLALNNLKQMVELPLDKPLVLKGDLEKFPPLPDSLKIATVFHQRPDYNALLWERKLRQKAVSVEFANNFPTLTADLRYTYSARSDVFRLENTNRNLVLGVNLHIPVFSGRFTQAQVQKARVELKKVNTRVSMLNDNVRIEINNIYLRLKEARSRVTAARKSVNTARRAFEIAESRTENGLSTQLELKDSRLFLDRAQLNYYTAIFDYLSAFFDWEKATGQVTLAAF